tara:strand:+ start:1730 stop:2581 length:852 start_codon:yes stop_codon:yes gene_type:complete
MEFSMPNKDYTLKPSTIETIDTAIYNLINDKFDLHTDTNSGFRKVPVLWMSPERAVNSKDKDIRDSVGKLKLPLISVDRTSFNKDPQFKGGWQANVFPDTDGPRGYRKHQRLVSREIAQASSRKFASSKSGQFNEQQNYPVDNKKVVYIETYAPIPVWVTVNYSVTLRTEYQQQMNDLMTPFATKTGLINALFAEYDGHRYETFIEGNLNTSNNTANLGEDERSFETKVDLKVLGYLLGDGINEEAPKVTTRETIVEVKLIRERSIVGDTKPWKSDDDSFREF